MTTLVDLSEANAEWFAAFKARFRFAGSFLDDPRNWPRLFLGDRLEMSIEDVRLGNHSVVIRASEISRANMLVLLNTVLVHEGEQLELYHISSTGEQVQEYGNEWVEHRIELEFRPRQAG